jgi:hypothetical protein
MRSMIFCLMFSLPVLSAAADKRVLEALPGLGGTEAPAREKGETARRPDAQKIMGELSATLKLSTRQEDRIAKAVNRKSREFDDAMEDYEKNSAEEKKWRAKMDKNAGEMEKISAAMPDVIREYLDDEQKQSYEEMLAARNKPAKEEALDSDEQAPAPARKKRLVRRKKGAAAPAGQDSAVPAEEAGGVMVDKEPPARKKRLVRRKKAAAAPAPAEASEEPAGAAPTGKTAPAAEDEDAGSYP